MQSPGSSLQILVVRADHIGDVVLSTPVFEVLKRHYPHSRITVMVSGNVAPLVRGLPGVDDVMVFQPHGRHSGIRGFFRLMTDIREGSFRIAVVLHSHRRIAAALFGAGVRHRVGPLSKLHSFLFYNRGVRQRRSEVEMHEADYNLQLLRKLGIRVGTRNVATQVSVSEIVRSEARAWLEKHGWSAPGEGKTDASHFVVVHPGMAGSALNWPEAHYAELIRLLLEKGHFVLVTGGPDERPLLARIHDLLELNKRTPTRHAAAFYGGPEAKSIDYLAALYSFADVVVAPSTGPLHVAAALGRRIVCFFPPIRVQSAIRWGPYLPDESRASVLVPNAYCGQDFSCRENLCNYYPCMKSITVMQAFTQVQKQLARSAESGGTQNG